MGILRRSLVCLAVFSLSGGLLIAQGAKGAQKRAPVEGTDVKSLFDQGLYSFDEGDFEGALAAFEKAFALSPTSDAISDCVKRAGEAKIFQMLISKDARISGIARQILDSSTRVYKTKMGDPEQVKGVVEDTLKSDGQDQLLKMVRNANDYGRNLVPALIPALADADLGRRAVAINWIGRYIGRDAIPVLQAARKHPSETVRRNVAQILGTRLVRHSISLATLKAMTETDPSNEVKSAASQSSAAILADMNGASKESSAKEYFLENAIGYYMSPHKNPFAGTQYTPTIYRLEGDRIVGEHVADFQFSDRMAQQALEESLELDQDFHEAQVLTLCNDAGQVYEYDLNTAYYAKNEAQNDVKAILESQKHYVDTVLRNRVIAWPTNVLYDGLSQALEDGKSEVARKIVETIRETERSGKAPESLVKALEDSSSRLVRISAAVALAHWNPTAKEFDAGERVISILSEAVLASGVRTAQKIMGDSQQANRMADLLDQLNMESFTPSDTVERGIDQVVSSPPDVIIMDDNVTKSSGKKEIPPINYFVSELRKNYRTVNVPVIVVVPASSLEKAKQLYESEERKVWVVPDSIDKPGLANSVFNKIFDDKDDSKAQATRLARSAAEALNYLATVPTRMPVRKSVESLRKVLKNRPDEVRIPSVMALGNLKASEAAGDLAAVFANAENAKEVRVQAMRAAGKALQGGGGSASASVAKIIEDGMESADLELRKAAWLAFSSSGADGKKHLKALLATPPAGGAAEQPAGDAPKAEEPVAKDGADAPAGDAAKADEPAPAEPTPEPAPAPEEEQK